ncbi:hypothetical protein MMC16_003906 [Acarospora aff. strigata]|nr:hypothetical protein [Acarospora aff. strigata]
MADSLPTSSTSHKVGTLHTHNPDSHRRRHQRSSSFPRFNFFRSKTRWSKSAKEEEADAAEEEKEEEQEPYEVAPGIWSNEATAKVFGYLDTPPLSKGERGKRSKSVEPSSIRQNQKIIVQGYQEVRAEDRLDPLSQRTPQRCRVESARGKEQASRPLEKAEAGTVRGRSLSRPSYRRMRTVSKDDTLVARGANPRTGVVSPYATSESAGSGSMTRGRRDESRDWREKKSRDGVARSASGKWMQDSIGWSRVESPDLSPKAQSERTLVQKRGLSMPVRDLQDRFVVNMPSAREPAPPQMSKEQIEAYQRSVERAYRKGGSQALVDPESLPTPRDGTPEGPSTPPRKLEKVRRKKLETAVSPRKASMDTVIIHNQARASSMPTPRKEQQQQQPTIRIVSPGHTVLDASNQTAEHNNESHSQQDPFLGVRQDAWSYQTSVIPSLSHRKRHGENRAYGLQSHEDMDAIQYARPPLAQTLSQTLPPVTLVHPKEASKPRPGLQSSHWCETVPAPTAASTTTITPITTTITPPHLGIARLDGTDSVPQANLLHGYSLQSSTPRVEFHPARPAAYVADSESLLAHQQRETTNLRNLEMSGMPRSLVAGPQRLRMEPSTSEYNSTYSPYPCQRAVRFDQEVVKERVQENTSAHERGREPSWPTLGNGGIPLEAKQTEAVAGKLNGCSDVERLTMKAIANQRRFKDQRVVADLTKPFGSEENAQKFIQLEVAKDSSSEQSSNVMVGESAESCLSPTVTDERTNHRDMVRGTDAATSLGGILQLIKDVVRLLEDKFNASETAWQGYVSLLAMTQHVLSTLNPASSAMKAINKADANIEDYIVAGKDVVLAGVYLLIVINVVMALGKILGVIKDILGFVWAPVRIIVQLLRLLTGR